MGISALIMVRWFAEYIQRGIEQGFRIGFHGEQASLSSHRRNMVSTAELPEVVDKYLKAEVSSKRIARIGPPEKWQSR